MNGMLLAAGFGERMLPLTLHRPKPTLPVLGRPLIHQPMVRMARAGYTDVVVNLHHLAPSLRAALEAASGPAMPRIHVSEEPTILGTAGGIRRAAERLRGAGPILLGNTDFLADVDLARLRAHHESNGAEATIVVAAPRPGYSTVELDGDDRVISLAGSPAVAPERVAARALFTGCHVIDESVIDRIPVDGPSDIVRDVYRDLALEGRLAAFHHAGYWWELGSPSRYLRGALDLLELDPRRRREVCPDADPVRRVGDSLASVGPGVRLRDDVRLAGKMMLGFACQLESGVHADSSIVMPEAWIGPGARLARTIVGPATEVPAGFEASDAVICMDGGAAGPLPPGVRRVDGLLVGELAAGAAR